MQTWRWMMVALVGMLIGGAALQANAGSWRVGGGVNYWEAVDDLDLGDIDSDGLSYVASLQYFSRAFGLGLDAELLPDRFGEDAYAPQVYLLIGKTIYAGAGVGWIFQDSEWSDDPFYSFRAGLDLAILEPLHLDVYGQYRFKSSQQLEDDATDIDSDTVFLGAAVRLAL